MELPNILLVFTTVSLMAYAGDSGNNCLQGFVNEDSIDKYHVKIVRTHPQKTTLLFPRLKFLCSGQLTHLFFPAHRIFDNVTTSHITNITVHRPRIDRNMGYSLIHNIPVSIQPSANTDNVTDITQWEVFVKEYDILGISINKPVEPETYIPLLMRDDYNKPVLATEVCWNEDGPYECFVPLYYKSPIITASFNPHATALANMIISGVIPVIALIILILLVTSICCYIQRRGGWKRFSSKHSMRHTSKGHCDANCEAVTDVENAILGPRTTSVDSELLSSHHHHRGTQTDVLHQTTSAPSHAEEQNRAVLGIPEFALQSGHTTIANTLAVTDSTFTNSIVNIWPSGKTSSTDEDLFWMPTNEEHAICKQISELNRRIITASLQYGKLLEEDEFTQTYQGRYEEPAKGPAHTVLIKMLKPTAPSNKRIALLQEAAILSQFDNQHVAAFYGAKLIARQVIIVTESPQNGNLSAYLKANRTYLSRRDSTPDLLLQFCFQIAKGMEYLSRKHFIHRDLRACNILLTGDLQCKISGFELARNMEYKDYYEVKGGYAIQLEWTAPEAIVHRRYNLKSDVWSYGMVMYEIWSLGHKPFEGLSRQQIESKHCDHYCHPPPPGCPIDIYKMMTKCWNPKYRERPTFRRIVEQFLQQTDILASVHSDEDIQNGFYVGAPIENGAHVYSHMQTMYQPHNQFGDNSKHYSYVRKQTYVPNVPDTTSDDDEESYRSLNVQREHQWLSCEQETEEADTTSTEYEKVQCENACHVQTNYESLPITQNPEETDTNASGYYNTLGSRENSRLNMTSQTSESTNSGGEDESVWASIPYLSPVYDDIILPTINGTHAAAHTPRTINMRDSPIYGSTSVTNGSSVSRKLVFNPGTGRFGRQE